MNSSEELQEWLKMVLSAMVSRPDEIEVEKKSDEMGVLYTVRMAKEDRGMLIGRGGINVNAVRTLLRHIGRMIDVRASLVLEMPPLKSQTDN
ncbi:hypothetical protein LCGC14_0641620 [marine sediment metagenome]|uniref:PH domain-containing protein n=1 Tax=marine sediment metagenome TaxID=412755 RepID=A0A0F9RII2_9ZZZZ|nr:KH domain-containing protein [archaeon]